MLKWVGLFFLFLLLGCVVITLIGSFANRGSKATPTPTVAAIARAASAGTQAPTTVPPTPGPPTTIPPTRTPAPTKIPTATPLPTATLTTRASLNAELAAALGTSNRKVARLQNVTLEGNSVTVGWAINDNVTEGMIKTSANLDLIRILKVVFAGGPWGVTEATLNGSFPMVDKYGNTSEDVVISYYMTAKTAAKVSNWDNVDPHNMYDIADDVLVVPAFQW